MLSANLLERAQRLRRMRIEQLTAGAVSPTLSTIFHVLPPESLASAVDYYVGRISGSLAIGGDSGVSRDSQGFFFPGVEREIRVFPTGAVEVVDCVLLRKFARDRLISSPNYEAGCLNYLRLFFRPGAPANVAAAITLVGVSGYSIDADSFRGIGTPGVNRIDQSPVELPILIVQDPGQDLVDAFRPIADALWQAAGWDGCRNYDLITADRVRTPENPTPSAA